MPSGSYQVKWSLYFERKQRQFATGVILDEKDVEFLKQNKAGLSGRVKDEYLRNLWNRIYGESYIEDRTGEIKEGILLKGQKALAKIESYFTFEMFVNVVSGQYIPEGQEKYTSDLIKALSERAGRLRAKEDISNANLFDSTAASFKRFAVWKKVTTLANPQLPFQIVTVDFLKDYEKWMLKYGKAPQKEKSSETPASITTIAIYCRNVRTVFNEAMKAGSVPESSYPFGEGKFTIPKVNNKKKALDEDVVSKIMYFECVPGSTREMARDLWIFSYLSNGLNFTDICHIKRSELDLKKGYIEIFREKTKETKREDMTKIHISLLPETIQIIEKWGSTDMRKDAFVFPFITAEMSVERRKAVIKQVIKNTNYHMNLIAKELKLDISINTYEARHTFATTLLRSEAPLAFISQSLGHSSFKTTQSYLGSFQDVQTKKYMNALIPKKQDVDIEGASES
jgi:integrase